MSTIAVPGDLLPILRQRLVGEVGQRAARLAEAAEAADFAEPTVVDIDAACDHTESLIAAHRALRSDQPTYPAAAVSAAAEATIEDAAFRIGDSGLSVDDAEALVRRVRACEALQMQIARHPRGCDGAGPDDRRGGATSTASHPRQ